MFDPLKVSSEWHYINHQAKEWFGNKIIAQGMDRDRQQQFWITRGHRDSQLLAKLDSFVAWANGASLVVRKNHKWGFVIFVPPWRNDSSFKRPSTCLYIPETFMEKRRAMFREADRKKERAKRVRLFGAKTYTGYVSTGEEMVISQWGTLYVPETEGSRFRKVGRVCGSTKTATGNPCKRWCNDGHCKGH